MTVLLQTEPGSAEALMDRVLRDGERIAGEYPLLFDPAFSGRLLSIDEEGEARSACGVLVRDFLVEGTRIRGGLIGSVVTDPEWRERGLATRLLDKAEDHLRAEGCAFTLLWAESPDFYYRRGYGPVGAEYDFALPFSLASRLPLPTGVRPMRPQDAAALHGLYERHPVRLCRTLEESRALFDCPGMTTLVRERDGRPVAYACLGRGVDLWNAVHEWGGSSDDLLPLLRAHLERLAGSTMAPQLYLMAPVSARDLTLRLEGLGTAVSRSMLALGKILDRGAAARTLTELLAPAGEVSVVGDSNEPDETGATGETGSSGSSGSSGSTGEAAATFRVRGPKDEGVIDDEGALAVLMGVGEVRQHVADFLTRFGLDSARLPLEPFVWGLDSI